MYITCTCMHSYSLISIVYHPCNHKHIYEDNEVHMYALIYTEPPTQISDTVQYKIHG